MNLMQQRFRHKLNRMKRDLEAQKITIANLECDFVLPTSATDISRNMINQPSSQSLIKDFNTHDISSTIDESNMLSPENYSQRKLSSLLQNERLLIEDTSLDSSQLPELKSINYSYFQLKEGKQSQNKRKFSHTPIRVHPPPNDELTPMQPLINLSEVKAREFIMINQDSSRNSLKQRSQSVSLQKKQKHRFNRFFDADEERQKSRIQKLLSNPIDTELESSFLRDLKQRHTLKNDPSMIIQNNASYITDEEAKVASGGKDYMSLPHIAISRNAQTINTLSKNYYRNLSQTQDYASTHNLNKSNRENVVKHIKQKASQAQLELKISAQTSRTTVLSPQQESDKKLTRDISKQTNVFERQRMLFDLIDQTKGRPLDVSGLFKHKSRSTLGNRGHQKQYSVLKTERATSSIIVNIQPTFPLMKEMNLYQNIEMQQDEELKSKISDIIQKQNPKVELYMKQQKMEKIFDLEQAIYRDKMIGMNNIVDQKLQDVSQKYLDDDYLYENFQKQLMKNTETKGKKLSANKHFSVFHCRDWPKQVDVSDHRGNLISTTGHKMDELQALKQQEEQMKQKLQLKKKKTRLHLPKGEQSTAENQTIQESDNESIRSKTPPQHSPGEQSMEELVDDQVETQSNLSAELKQRVKVRAQLEANIQKLQGKRLNGKQKEKLQSDMDNLKKEKERIKEIKQNMEDEEEEYWHEWQDMKQHEMLENVQVFLDKKKDEINLINNEIIAMENDSDDEFGLFQNFANTQAHIAAKAKVMREEQKLEKNKQVQKMLLTTIHNTNDVKKKIVKGLQNIKRINDASNLASNPSTMNQTQLILGQTQIDNARENVGFRKAMEKAQQKQEFARHIVEVYQKNENVNYDKQLQKQRHKKRLLARRQGKYDDEEEGEDYQDDFEDSDDQYRSDTQEYEKEELERERQYESQQLQQREKDEQNDNMAKKYLQFCKNEKVLPLPIMQKINDRVLSLEDYKLNMGLCKALGSVLEDLGQQIFKIALTNNGISDSCYAQIIRGAIKNKHIKSLVIRNNEFKEESLKEMLLYFEPSRRPVIEELVISACKTKLSHINQLLKALSDYTNLTSLALCQTKLDKESVHYIADVANGNTKLRELDLSWNEVTSLNMWELIQNIEFCRHISFLNLSFNSFAGSKTQDIVDSLSNFIRRNRSLIHLDISYCGLRRDEVFKVTQACKKSRSLMAVHLSGNIINDETKQKIRDYMHPRKRIKDMYDKINAPDSDDEVLEVKIGNFDLAAAINEKLRKYAAAEALEGNKDGGSKSNNTKGNPDERLIFSRILGHLEIPRAHKWQESTDCWICDKHRYTVLITSKTIADNYFVKPKSKDKEQFLKKIRHAQHKQQDLVKQHHQEDWGSDNDEIYYDADTEDQKYEHLLNYQVSGTFSRWKCRSMMPLSEYLRRLRKNSQPTTRLIQIEKDIYEKKVKELKARSIAKDVEKRERLKQMAGNQSVTLQIDNEDSQWVDHITPKDGLVAHQTWIRDLELLIPDREQVNFVIGLDKIQDLFAQNKSLSEMTEKLYVYAAYLPPGKHNTCVLYNTTNRPKKNLYHLLAFVRQRELPLQITHKKVKEYRIIRKFEKPKSMFKDWVDNTPQLLKKAFQKDLECSKISRFIRDILEFRRVQDVLIEYTDMIKDIFTYSISISSFPSISWIDFTNLCSEWQIPDNKTCTMQTIDRVFIATNVELVEQEDNPDRDLCRFEFYEIIVRMGGAKYKDSGQCDTWDAATKMLLDKNLIPNMLPKMQGGQAFRDQFIWTLPIDDLFRANIEKLTKLYQKFTSSTKRWPDMDDIKQMVKDLQLADLDIAQAYAFSKMTIVDEMNQKEKYERMQMCEFLDFLCRIAYMKHKEDKHLSQVEKVERVMDLLLKQIDAKREKPSFEIEVSSQSDYSSDD